MRLWNRRPSASRLVLGALVAGLVIAMAATARAGIRPSFGLESCTTAATHIVVVTEGEKIDGDVEVLESWKGDLEPGAKLTVPDLAAFESDESRAIFSGFRERNAGDPERVTGQRMVLFLKHEGTSWVAAARYGGMKVSVVWLEAGKPYAFVQIENPGDAVLVSRHQSEAEFHDELTKLLGDWARIEAARALADPAARANALEPFTRVESSLQSTAAFDGIATAGSAALPVLRSLIADEKFGWKRRDAVTALARAAGADGGPELVRLFEPEIAYWKETGPTLRHGWWTNQPDIMPVENRYSFVLGIIDVLGKLRVAEAVEPLTRFRDFWRSLSQLEDPSGLMQMSQACDSALKQIAEGGSPVLGPRSVEAEPAPARSTAAPEPDAPLTTPDDEKRVAELETDLARELEAERERTPMKRPVFLGTPNDHEVNAEVSAFLENVTPIAYEDSRLYHDTLVRPAQTGSWPLPLSEGRETLREHLAANVSAAASLFNAERVGRAFDVEKSWGELCTTTERGGPDRVDGAEAAFILEALHSLGDGSPDGARHASDLALDLWRLQHDLRVDDRRVDARRRTGWGGDVGEVLTAAIPRLDASALDEVDRRLALLESTLPAFGDEVRRRRLACGCFFRAYHRGELKGTRADDTWGERGADATPLDHLSPRARLTDRRVGAIRREWDKLDALFREHETALARGKTLRPAKQGAAARARPPRSRSSPRTTSLASWEAFLAEETDRYLGDVGRLRLMRVLVGAQRFRLAKGKWPETAKEAVGAELAAKLVDPLGDGEPFVLEVSLGGELLAKLSPGAGRQAASRSYRLEPPKK